MNKFQELRLAVGDRVASLFSSGDNLTPPAKLNAMIGGGDFKALGKEFLDYFTRIGGLKPDHRVLDIGCGCGRMAVPLLGYLSAQGSYEGFDIMGVGVDWCRRHIGAKDTRFHFQRADVYNQYYNPKGRYQPIEYRFPFADGSFDFFFLTSVFTHMLRYLAEAARVLKPGGRCMVSYFLVNPESQALMESGRSAFYPRIVRERCMILREDKPEQTVTYQESFVRECFARENLQAVEPILYGSWSGRKPFLSFQDLILAVKQPARR